jgi:uncharacterized protein YndB with AHSA1/START domain
MIQHEVTFEVPRPVGEVFDYLSDVTKTPQWLARCVKLEQLSPGPLATGSKLAYTYREGGRQGSMEGEAATVDRNRALLFRYWDKMFKVQVGFDFEAAGAGARVRHHIQIEPVSFMMKVVQPLIRMATVKQTAKDIAKLQELLSTARAA